MLISLSQAIEPKVCDAWPVQRQIYSYHPNNTASLPIGRYQFILLGEHRHMCVNNLPMVVREAERPGLEPAASRLQVQCPNHYATKWRRGEILKILHLKDIFTTKVLEKLCQCCPPPTNCALFFPQKL